MASRVSYSDGAWKMMATVPSTQASVNSHRKSRSSTMATYFQSWMICNTHRHTRTQTRTHAHTHTHTHTHTVTGQRRAVAADDTGHGHGDSTDTNTDTTIARGRRQAPALLGCWGTEAAHRPELPSASRLQRQYRPPPSCRRGSAMKRSPESGALRLPRDEPSAGHYTRPHSICRETNRPLATTRGRTLFAARRTVRWPLHEAALCLPRDEPSAGHYTRPHSVCRETNRPLATTGHAQLTHFWWKYHQMLDFLNTRIHLSKLVRWRRWAMKYDH